MSELLNAPSVILAEWERQISAEDRLKQTRERVLRLNRAQAAARRARGG